MRPGPRGSLEAIILHQLLGWHHFYDRGSQATGLVADGIFHLVLVAGLLLLRAAGSPSDRRQTRTVL